LNKLGKYEVLAELGRGAMGVVYCARDPIINRLVAVKTITTGVAADPALLQRFYREAQSAGGLQHPNIVTIYDMGEQNDIPYIAMELIEGESLENMIARRPVLPIALKLIYILQACRAFDYAHKRGIVHRDIKPANIMVTKNGAVKVVDFGIARVVETSKTQTGMLIGTFAYMSPEQYHGEHADERSDIWSFGVLMYELFCGQRPFVGNMPASLMRSICDQDLAPLSSCLPECPPELEAIIARVLQKSPDNRFQSMEELLMELEALFKRLQAGSVAELVDQCRGCVERNCLPEARELLSQALQIETGNQQVRGMLEKINAELKRTQVRPKAQQLVEKGQAFLQEGKILDAKVAAESALQLDSGFEPARDLQRMVDEEMGRAELVASWLDSAKLHLAQGQPEEAETLLARILRAEPDHKQAIVFHQQALKDKLERQKRLRLLERLAHARALWTRQEYRECIQLLVDLGNEFPKEEEVSRLLETVRDDQAEQRLHALADSQNLLLCGRYEECVALITRVQEQFPSDLEIPALLLTARNNQRHHRRSEGLAEAKEFLAGGRFGECISLLSTLCQEFPDEPELVVLLENARQRQREDEKQQRVTKAHQLLAGRRYAESAALLMSLKNEFPNDVQILNLLDLVRTGQNEQRKRDALAEARKLVSSKQYDQAISVLNELHKDFPNETAIGNLLETARRDQAEQHKQQELAAARAHLASQSFAEALVLLDQLAKKYPNDGGIGKLRVLAQREQEEHSRSQRVEGELNALKKLISEKKYSEVLSRTKQLFNEFPGEPSFRRLVEFASSQQESIEKDRLLRNAIEEASALFAARRYQEAMNAAESGLEIFPARPELLKLYQEAEIHHRKQQVQQRIEERIRQIRVKINCEEFSDAIDLARNALATLGPDTHVSQLLNAAEVEVAAREKKKEQRRALETIRTLIDTGQLEAAGQALDKALESKVVEELDPRSQRLAEQIRDAKRIPPREPPAGPPASPPDLSREYAFFQSTPTDPVPPQEAFLHGPSTPQGAATQRALSPQSLTSYPASGETSPLPPALPLPGGPPAQANVAKLVEPADGSFARATAPVERKSHLYPADPRSAESVHRRRVPIWRRPPVVTLLLLGAAAAVWVAVRSTAPEILQPVPEASPPAPKQANSAQIEKQEQSALDAAGPLIAANDLDGARSKLEEAAALKGPLAVEIQSRISAIDESKKDPNLRQLRRREEQLWQMALKRLGEGRFMEAQTGFRQIVGLEPGGVHRDDAKNYLDKVIPLRLQETELIVGAHLDLVQGEFQSARIIAAQIQKNGSDPAKLLAEIDEAERTQIAKLESEFNEFKQGDDDKAVQRLNALWPKFQELAVAGGPQSGEALDYVNTIPGAMSDVQARMQQKNADAVFQRMTKAYQQAARLNDKSGLTAASTDFQSIIKGDGTHADEARQYLTEVNDRLAALSRPSAKPAAPIAGPNRENSIKGALQLYARAFEQRDADALVRIWPTIGAEYEGYKLWFEKVSSIRMNVEIESIQLSPDGASAVVKARANRQYTSIDSKAISNSDAKLFELSKVDGAWIITDVQSDQLEH